MRKCACCGKIFEPEHGITCAPPELMEFDDYCPISGFEVEMGEGEDSRVNMRTRLTPVAPVETYTMTFELPWYYHFMMQGMLAYKFELDLKEIVEQQEIGSDIVTYKEALNGR